MLVLEKTQKFLRLYYSHLTIHLSSRILSMQEVFLIPFLPLSNRTAHTNAKLLRKYWADSQNEWFGIRARCLKHPHWSVWCLCYFLFQDPTTQSTDTLEHWMTCIFESFHHLSGCRVPIPSPVQGRVPYHLLRSPRPRNVQCPCENLFAYSLTFYEFKIQIPSFPLLAQSMSLNVDMKMI